MTTLSVENLPLSMTAAMLLQMFAEFGAISATVQISANGHPPRTCGLVTRPDSFSALTAIATLNGKQTPGQAPISVSIKN